MIYTVTMNPSVDLFTASDQKTIIKAVAGGKGVNVSRTLANLMIPSKAIVLLGGVNGKRIAELLSAEQFEYITVHGEINNRINIKITGKNESEMNGTAKIENFDADSAVKAICGYLTENDVLAISGSLPAGIGNDFYGKLIETAKKKGIKTFIDICGKPLIYGILSKPYCVKINKAEAKILLDGITDFTSAEALNMFSEKGINYSGVTDGELGAAIMRHGSIYERDAKRIKKTKTFSSVGAGDAFLAGMITADMSQMDGEKILDFCMTLAEMTIGEHNDS